MTRRCDVLTEDQRWRPCAREELSAGMVFRLFEEDGTPVTAEIEETGERVDRWRMTDDGRAEPIPESGVERAVREGGFYWPTGQNTGDAGGVPRRLR